MKFLKRIYLYTILIQGISTIFIDQMSTKLVFKRVRILYADQKIFNNLPPNVTILKNYKAKFKAALG
jgi:hypothetical protein